VAENFSDAGPRMAFALKRNSAIPLWCEVLELVRKHPSHLNLDFVHITDEEADLLVARERQQRARAEERERLPVRRYLNGCGERLAGDVAADPLHSVFDPQENVATHGRIEFESMSGFAAASSKSTVRGWMDGMPFSLYSVSWGAVTRYRM